MTTELEKKSPIKTTGRRYASVKDLMPGEGIPSEVQTLVAELREETKLVQRLTQLRVVAGLTQEQMAKQLNCTQGTISKIESGRDEDLTIGIIKAYAQATRQRIGMLFGKPMNHVEAVKNHAFGIKKHLSALAGMAHGDQDMERAIQTFFGEAFFNILDILSHCQQEMPNGGEVEVRFQLMDPSNHQTKRSSSKSVSEMVGV